MRCDPLDVATATAITISRGTTRKRHQNLAWAVGYNSLARLIAAGVFEPLGFVLARRSAPSPGPAPASSSRSTPVALKRLSLPKARRVG